MEAKKGESAGLPGDEMMLERVKKHTDKFKVGVAKMIIDGFSSLAHYDAINADFEIFASWKTLVEAQGSSIPEIHDAKQAVKTHGPFWERRFTKFKFQT